MKKTFVVLALSISVLTFAGCSGKTVSSDEKEGEVAQAADRAAVGEDAPEPTVEAPPVGKAAAPQVSAKEMADPNSEKSLYARFNVARADHNEAQANQLAGEILSRNPNDVKVLNALAAMAIDQEKFDLARLLVNKVIEKDANNAAAYDNLGVIELKTGNLRLALVQFKKATAIDITNRAAHANLGAIYLQYRNYQGAAQELTAAVEHGDSSPETMSNLGFALVGTGDYGNAAKYYEKALAKEPNNVSIMLNYATLLVEHANRAKDAYKILNKIRFVAREPAILDKVEALLKKADNPAPAAPAKGVSE